VKFNYGKIFLPGFGFLRVSVIRGVQRREPKAARLAGGRDFTVERTCWPVGIVS
jgi:hypothetical protein